MMLWAAKSVRAVAWAAVAAVLAGCESASLWGLPQSSIVRDDRIVGHWALASEPRTESEPPTTHTVQRSEQLYTVRADIHQNVFLSLDHEFPEWMSYDQQDELREVFAKSMEMLLPRYTLALHRIRESTIASVTLSSELESFVLQNHGAVILPAYQFALIEFEGDDRVRLSLLDQAWLRGAAVAEDWEFMPVDPERQPFAPSVDSDPESIPDYLLLTHGPDDMVRVMEYAIENRSEAFQTPLVFARLEQDEGAGD